MKELEQFKATLDAAGDKWCSRCGVFESACCRNLDEFMSIADDSSALCGNDGNRLCDELNALAKQVREP